MIQASICTIGDEILIGQIIDTNSYHISRALNSAGIKISRMLSIGDNLEDIVNLLDNELKYNDIVIITGGLGPTKDDITKKALSQLSGSDGENTDERQLEIVHKILHSRGLDTLDINLAQASVPNTAEVIPNKLGTAPIMVFRFPEERFSHKPTLYSLPGVPYEAIGALNDVIEDITLHYPSSPIIHKTIMTFGMAESELSKKIETWEDSLPEDIHLAYLPDTLKGVRLRLSVYGDSHSDIDNEILKLKTILGDIVYSEQDDTLHDCVGRELKNNGKTISVAESCTGGTLSQLLTSMPGSSEFYLGGVTSYANSVKNTVLGVSEELINSHGAVSCECVAAMAEGVRSLTGSDFSVATSGIAGPGGGSDDKPVGTLWVGVSSQSGTETFKFTCKGDRKRNIERFSAFAMVTILKKIRRELSN